MSVAGETLSGMNQCHFIPPYLLERIVASDLDAELARCGHATLAVDEELRASRIATPPLPHGAIAPRSESGEDAWTVYTADNGTRRRFRRRGTVASGVRCARGPASPRPRPRFPAASA